MALLIAQNLVTRRSADPYCHPRWTRPPIGLPSLLLARSLHLPALMFGRSSNFRMGGNGLPKASTYLPSLRSQHVESTALQAFGLVGSSCCVKSIHEIHIKSMAFLGQCTKQTSWKVLDSKLDVQLLMLIIQIFLMDSPKVHNGSIFSQARA